MMVALVSPAIDKRFIAVTIWCYKPVLWMTISLSKQTSTWGLNI
jgi:hypothetical protein